MITRFTLHLIYMTLMAFIYIDWMIGGHCEIALSFQGGRYLNQE